jgi:hypothetical protein
MRIDARIDLTWGGAQNIVRQVMRVKADDVMH